MVNIKKLKKEEEWEAMRRRELSEKKSQGLKKHLNPEQISHLLYKQSENISWSPTT